MYNGIGLQTARGSGTNGYVQRNLSFVKQTKNKVEYRTEDDFAKLEQEMNRPPNQEILDHQKKRHIELKCLELTEDMESQGYTREEIESKVNRFRDKLSEESNYSKDSQKEWLSDRFGTNVKETHRMAELNHERNDKLKNALGISPFFIEGSSMDATRKAKEALAAEALLQTKKYQIIKEPSPEPALTHSKNKNEKNENKVKKEKSRKDNTSKKRHSRKDSSESESDSNSDSIQSADDSKKRKKQKIYEKKSNNRKNKRKREHKSRKYSESSDSDSETTSSSSDESMSKSETSSSSDSSIDNSKYSRKGKYSTKRESRSSSSPDISRKTKSYYVSKGSSHEKDDYQKTSSLIEKNIKEMRKEMDESVREDKIGFNKNNLQNPTKYPYDKKHRSRDSRSRSYSSSSIDEPKAKRMKSTVHESDGSKRAKRVPQTYSSDYYKNRSESRHSPSPKDKKRNSQHRSSSVESRDRRKSRSHSKSSYSSSDTSSRSPSRSRSRSRSIPRRKGSPSFLDKRRITSARKRPIPYRRGSPALSSHSTNYSDSRSRSRSRSLSHSSSYSYTSNKNI